MFRKTLVILLVFLLAGLASAKDANVNPALLTNDVDPNARFAPVPNYSPDNMWDVQFDYDIQGLIPPTPHVENQLLGCEFDGAYFWFTGGGGTGGTRANSLYKFDANGSYVAEYLQSSTSGWGWRDLAWDGTYLYCSEEGNAVSILDPTATNPGTPVNSINVIAPPAFPRALAYDPVSDHFYAGNFSSGEYEFDRNGNVLRTAMGFNLSTYGMAWDDDAPDGPWLWLHGQVGTPAATVYQIDPTTFALTGVSHTFALLGTNTDQIAGGLAYSADWATQYSTMIAMVQGTPNDRCGGYEMYMLANLHAPAAPTNFTVSHNQTLLQATLAWTNPSQTVGGQTLTDLDGAKIFRADSLLHTMTNVQIGQPSTWNDNNVPSVGLYTYRVLCYNDSGDGLPAATSAWIGLDVPGAPSNVTATPDPNLQLECTIAWTAPTAGANGGYWPAGSWTGQKVYRNGSVVADLTGTNTQHVDHPATQGWYSYAVSYYNASGEGPAATATPDPVFVGPPEYLPQPYNWVEINTVGVNSGVTGDDQNLGPFPMGIQFPWYDNQTYNQIRICSNGFLSFTSTSTVYSNTAIPTSAEPNNMIAPYWDDMHPRTGTIWYYYDAANDRFIVEYDGVGQFAVTNAYFKFEAILYSNGLIDFMYDTLGGTLNSATVGIENGAGTAGIQTTYNGSGPLEPQNDTGIRIFGPFVQISDLRVTLTPHNPPIRIPAGGGAFIFDAAITNTTNTTITFDAWTEAVLPNGSVYGPIILRTNLPIAGGQTIMRIISQYVPVAAPPGNYAYRGKVGTHPGTVIDQDSFPFQKLAGDAAPNHNQGWAVYGWFGDEALVSAVSDFELTGVHPNPFNPSTQISFALPEAAKVVLTVYDVSGRQVANLVNGWLSPGSHEISWEASSMPSGVYFARLQAADYSETVKMLLVK